MPKKIRQAILLCDIDMDTGFIIGGNPIVRCKDCVAYNGDHHYCYNDIFAVENGYCYNARNKEEPNGGWPDENWDVGIYHD